MNGRGPYELDKVYDDDIDVPVTTIVEAIWAAYGHKIILVSGREDYSRDDTERWLRDHEIKYDALFMRASDDKRKDYIVKAEIFDQHIRHNYNVVGVLDDRDQVVAMWRSIGLKTLQVAEGNF